ncbi:hypothetical protein [Mycobacterium angelicum]|uniref:hypothetical protein n=1 Tax=Mycobacterium angelicum TaxID=470074 RepID=UPI00111C0137|nr:hypothetical protein [Mycobacterium angelicum]MCV7198520.1 hypothetical protein [Mycobacterium angelicum]
MVDGLNRGFWRRRVKHGIKWEGVANPGDGCGDVAGNLPVEGDQLCGTLADVGGEGLGLGVSGGALRSRAANEAIVNRKVFVHNEFRRVGILNRVTNPGAGRIEVRGPDAGYFGGFVQLVCNRAGRQHVGVRRAAQRVGGFALPINR